LDSTLRTKLVYKTADSLESTKKRITRLLLEHHSGKMEEDGTFTYQANFLFSPRLFNKSNTQMVYGKGMLGIDDGHTLIRFTICPNLVLVFFALLIFPILIILAIFENKYLIPGGKHSVLNIILVFLVVEGLIFFQILASTYLLKQNFEKRFDLSESQN
jgi:hypothetical protein